MAKYRVDFSEFAYVEADNPDEAKEFVQDGEYTYMEMNYDIDPQEVDDFEVYL